MTKLLPVVFALCLTGCLIDPDCDPGEEDYDVDRVLTQGDLDEVGVDCDALCRWAYREETGWSVQEIYDCTLDVTPQPGADPATEVGSVVCSVHGLEYWCD
jgi:hypothetical protein